MLFARRFMSIYNFPFKDIQGNPFNTESLKNKVVLIVNTATQCGGAPQLRSLQTLYDTYKDRGLIVLGFPSNDFYQESSDNPQEVCEMNYGVKFPILEKIHVNGSNTHPLYQYLKKQKTWSPLGFEIVRW